MQKIDSNLVKKVLKIVVALATALLGVIGGAQAIG
ncbi:MAG: DUF6486 family protein [Prevotella sp.]|nr:DUF6486 family protein [Prevotella sp.]